MLDADGERVGKLSEIHFLGSRPLVGEIRRGRFTRRVHLVPLQEASLADDGVHLPYRISAIEAAGGLSEDGTVGTAELCALRTTYGVDLGTVDVRELMASRGRRARAEQQRQAYERARRLEEEAQYRADEAAAAQDEAERAAAAAAEARAARARAEEAAARARAAAEQVTSFTR